MLDVLINPDNFFEARKKGVESLKVPLLIVLISGVIGGIAAFLMAGITLEMLSKTLPPEALGIALTVGRISAFIGALVVSLLIWVVFAAVFFGISSLLKGEGTFTRTLEFVGYGYIPMILSGMISAVLMYNFISTAQIPQVTDPTEIAEVIKQWMTNNPMVQLSSIIGILFMLWSANIWVFGLKHARNLSTKNALITVGIPVAVYILYSVWQLGVLG
ncbi:MAG: YIP1 family protein [archaeon]|nr:YIP1 family protein [archaeon]